MDSTPRDRLRGRGQAGVFTGLILAAVAVVVLTIMLALGLSIVGGVVDGIAGDTAPSDKLAAPNTTVGTAVGFEDTSGDASIEQVYSVQDSRGYAIRLSGADDSYVKSDADLELASDDTWTVATWARVRGGQASANMTALSADGRVLLQYNGSRSEWSAWYYDESNRNSYRVNVSAPAQPGNLTWVAAWHNGSHLTVYANTTQGEIVSTTGSNIASATTSAGNWNGSLDETRAFDDALNSSQRHALVSDGVGPLPNATRTARLMYDENSGDSTRIFFAGPSASLSNHTWVDGLPGRNLTAGTDYQLDEADGTITALAGGRLVGAPVAWVDYEYAPRSPVADLGLALVNGFTLFASGAILIPAVAVLALLVGGLTVYLRRRGGPPGARPGRRR